MLVLSRKKDESIILDGQIEIQVLKIKGNTVRLGIKAPAHIKVLRGELSPFDIEVEIEKDDDGVCGMLSGWGASTTTSYRYEPKTPVHARASRYDDGVWYVVSMGRLDNDE